MNQSVINNLAAKINSKEQKSNKVTSLSSSSTDAQYPSAKAVYDRINALELQVGEDCGTFAELQTIINNAQSGDTIILDKDYKNSGNESDIEIEKTLKIVGNGHIIDADKHSVIFELSYNVRNTVFDNITFLNGEKEYYNSGAIAGSYITVTNCNFINCKASYNGGAISSDNLKIYNSSFINCCVENEEDYEADGGAIYGGQGMEIVNCIFLNNSAGGTGASIWYDRDNYSQGGVQISNCIFKDNVAQNGYGLYSEYNVNVYNCTFENTTTYNVTNVDYLTSHQDITGKENINNKVSSWSSPTTNTNYPSAKLVKDSLDLKADKTTTLDTTNLSAYVENKFLILTDEEEEEMITIGCGIIWSDQNNSSKVRPLSVKCTLSDGSQYILSNINDWSITIQVPKYDASNEEIQYSWSIAEVNGYTLTNTNVNNNITTFTLYKRNSTSSSL